MLVDLHDRLIKLGDHLLGCEPRDASDLKGAPEPMPSLHRNLMRAQQIAAALDDVQLAEFAFTADQLGMDVLVEVHDLDDVPRSEGVGRMGRAGHDLAVDLDGHGTFGEAEVLDEAGITLINSQIKGLMAAIQGGQ